MSLKPDKKFLYSYYRAQANDRHRMYQGGGFREYKQLRRLNLIKELLKAWDPGRGLILDIGCGDGHAASLLFGEQTPPCLGLDYSLEKLRKFAGNGPKRMVLLGDAESLPLKDECVDYVVCLETLEHLPTPGACMREAARVLKRGGWCLISMPVNSALQPFIKGLMKKVKKTRVFDEHIQTITPQDLKQMLMANGFNILHLSLCGFNIPLFNFLTDRIPYSWFAKLDGVFAKLPLPYTGAGIHAGISLGVGNEYAIAMARKI